MDSVGNENRFAPPQAAVADIEANGGELVPAGRGRRLGAVIIDALILVAALWILSLFTPWNPFARDPQAGAGLMRPALLNQLIGFALFLAVNGYLLATRGQTVAKAMLGVRVVRIDGSPASFGRQVLRFGTGYVLAVLPMLGFLFYLVDSLMIFRASRRCLHDEIAGTVVIKA